MNPSKSKLFNISVQLCLLGCRANKCSYGWPQLILHSSEYSLNVSTSSNMNAYKICISCSQIPPFFIWPQLQLRLCSLTHWAIHHRWRRLLWKLAAILPLGKNHLNGAKMAPGKPCDASVFFFLFFSFFAFIFGQPCLSCCGRITNLFYLAKNWAIRTHFIIMIEQYVTNFPNNVWKWMWIGKVRDAHTKRRHGCDGLRPIPEGWEGGLWANTVPFSIFHGL